jgi:hypothetical protein
MTESETKHYFDPALTPGLAVQVDNRRREVRLKRGYVVHNDSGEIASRAIQSMSFTGPYVPNNLDSYSKKIGPSCLSREGYGKELEMNSTGSMMSLSRKRNNEANQGTTLHIRTQFHCSTNV